MLTREWPIYGALARKWCGYHDRRGAAVNDDTLPKLAGDLALVSAYNRRRCLAECSAWQERFKERHGGPHRSVRIISRQLPSRWPPGW
jgi:hypothetical protein